MKLTKLRKRKISFYLKEHGVIVSRKANPNRMLTLTIPILGQISKKSGCNRNLVVYNRTYKLARPQPKRRLPILPASIFIVNIMQTEEIISLLDDVRPAGAGAWTASCPNRAHRSARLSVKDVGDKTLLKCWGGCSVSELTSAIGITVSDLFASEMPVDIKDRFSYDKLYHERLIIQLASRSTRPLSNGDIERVKVARYRLRVGGWLKLSDDLISRDHRRLLWLS